MFVTLFGAAVALAACTEGPSNNLTSGGMTSSGTGGSSSTSGTSGGAGGAGGAEGGAGGSTVAPPKTILDERVKDYNEALRTASLKLVRDLPTLEQIKALQQASNKKVAYEEAIDELLADPRFAARLVKYWKDVMRQAGGANNGMPSRDTAPNFAARVMWEDQPFTNVFTAASNNCPSFDGNTTTFGDGECNNGAPQQAGVLTNPGTMSQFYGNMAFRRVRWVQEVFVCTKFPAEYSDSPVQMGAADYMSPWEFETVVNAPINFQDTSSVICANCHTTMNHIAPLFGRFDANGQHQNDFAVMTPIAPDPVTTQFSHWLRDGEQLSWRMGEPTPDFASLGQAVANDPDVHECAVARMWNWAFSKEDIVTDLATVPSEVIEQYVGEFIANGYNLKDVLRSILKSDDFVSF